MSILSSLLENQVKMAIKLCKCSHLTSGWVRVAAHLAKPSLPITKFLTICAKLMRLLPNMHTFSSFKLKFLAETSL